jgi:hypothetical protein
MLIDITTKTNLPDAELAEFRRDLVTVAQMLREDGYTWFSLGSRVYRDDGRITVWFNGSQCGTGRGDLARQPWGWFTLDDLLGEKFAEPCR